MPLLVTDLDNTLYDWVTFFALSFQAMLGELSRLLDVPEERLIQEFKEVHQHYGNSEQPFAVLELPSARKRFGDVSRREMMAHLSAPLYAFNAARKVHLKLYPGVEETLAGLTAEGVTVVAHTEAIAANALYRLRKLGVERYFTRLYTLEGCYAGHPDPAIEKMYQPPQGFVHNIPRAERKPNPMVLQDICRRENVSASDTWYVGDSLARDISMAQEAHVKSIWARYGACYDKRCWQQVVAITHWTEADVKREETLRAIHKQAEPDYVIDFFSELCGILLSTPKRATQTTSRPVNPQLG